MLKNGFKIVGVMLLAFLLHRASFAAEVIHLPPEELAQESVLPVFDRPVVVRNRNVETAGKIDVGVFYGYAMTEPIANVSKFGLGIYYNTSEYHAFGLLYAHNMTGLSDYAHQIERTSGTPLDFTRAPMPKSTIMADYNLKMFYGKLSLTKSLVLNTILYGSGSLGMIQYDHKMYPAAAVGLGQKFFFGKHWALRFDLRLYTHQGPIPFLGGGRMHENQPRPSFDEFKERVMFATNLDAGLSYLF